MTDLPRLTLILPGDPDQLTGGTLYDRRMLAGLRTRGWQVTVHGLPGDWPWPDAAARRGAADTLAAIPAGERVLVDGLALGALPGEAAREARRLCLLALVHHPLALETGLDPVSAAALHRAETAALAATRRVIVTSPATARLLPDLGVAPARVRVVEPGTDPAPLAIGSPPGAPLQLLCVASLIPRKNHLALLDALALLRAYPWRLTLIGSPQRDLATAAAVAARIAAHGLTARVLLAGEVDARTLAAAWAAADLFVLPSRFEGYGMAFAEALAHGLPVLGLAAGAVPETVPADAGLLLPVTAPVDELAAALARLLTDPALRARLAAGARRARARLPDWTQASARLAAALTLEGVAGPDSA